MERRFLILVILIFLLAQTAPAITKSQEESINAETDELLELLTPEKKESLNFEALQLLGEMETLQKEIREISSNIGEMESQLLEAKETLKKISTASIPARHYKRLLKELPGQLEIKQFAMKDKMDLLESKVISFSLIEEQLRWSGEDVEVPLLNILSKQMAPKEE